MHPREWQSTSSLQRFNANFRVGPVDPVNTRGGSAANTLLIDGNLVPLSGNPESRASATRPSAGDCNALALAFFFASLQNDPQRGQRVVVIDDPMTSLDEDRTLHHTAGDGPLGPRCGRHGSPVALEVVSARRLGQVPAVAEAAMEVRRSGPGSTVAAWGVNAAMVTEHDRLHAAASANLQQADPAMKIIGGNCKGVADRC